MCLLKFFWTLIDPCQGVLLLRDVGSEICELCLALVSGEASVVGVLECLSRTAVIERIIIGD